MGLHIKRKERTNLAFLSDVIDTLANAMSHCKGDGLIWFLLYHLSTGVERWYAAGEGTAKQGGVSRKSKQYVACVKEHSRSDRGWKGETER